MNAANPTETALDHFPLAHGYLFGKDGVGREIGTQTAIEWLHGHEERTGEFIWLHFHSSLDLLNSGPLHYLELPETFEQMLRDASSSTRIAPAQHDLVAVLNDVDYDVQRKKPLEVATLRLRYSAW